MSKDIIKFPPLGDETITVKNFLVIEDAEMKCGDITVLVGEQGMGKSLLAKLRYFFWEYQNDLWRFTLPYSLHESRVNVTKRYYESKTRIFCDLFPNIEKLGNKFSIRFQSGKIDISVKRNKKGAGIKIKHSEDLENFVKDVHDFVDKNKIENSIRFSSRELDLESMPSVLYVTASRLFFATLEENPYKFLDSKKYNFDLLLREFGNFWGNQKKGFSDKFKNAKKDDLWFKDAKKVLAGDYVHRNDIDYIKTTWGETVELKDASSGQQEALPLLAAINAFPNDSERNQLLIIEEPEAHIYPTSQKVLIKMIADVVRKKDCKVMITTHSPYIPACVNNEIIRAQNLAVQDKGKCLAVSAYHVSKNTARSIYYENHDLIDVDKLDEVSDEIADEYYDLTQEQDSPKNNKGKDRG